MWLHPADLFKVSLLQTTTPVCNSLSNPYVTGFSWQMQHISSSSSTFLDVEAWALVCGASSTDAALTLPA